MYVCLNGCLSIFLRCVGIFSAVVLEEPLNHLFSNIIYN